MAAQNDFKITFALDLTPFASGLKSMLTMTQAAGQQIRPLLNLELAAPDFSPFEKELVRLKGELKQYTDAQEQATAGKDGLTGATTKLADAEKKSRVATDMMSSSFKQAFFAISAVQQVSGILINTFGGLIASSNEQERSEAAYAQALRNRGLLTAQSITDVRAFSSGLQELTGFQDEQTIETMAQLAAMGLQSTQLKDATKLAGDLAVVMGTDMRTAARLMADAFNGNTGQLGRYVKGLDEADIKQRGTVSIIEQLQTAVGGQAEAFGNTGPGKMKIFGAAVDDVRETLGGLLKEAVLPFLNIAKPFLDWFKNAPSPIQAVTGAVMLTTVAFIGLQVTGIGGVIKQGFILVASLFPRMIAGLTATTTAAYGAAGGLAAVQIAGFGLLAVIGLITAFVGFSAWMQYNQAQTRKMADETERAKNELEKYKEALKEKARFEVEIDTRKLKRDIFDLGVQGLQLQEQMDDLTPAAGLEVSAEFKAQKENLKSQQAAIEAQKESKKNLLSINNEYLGSLDQEDARFRKLLESTNDLVRANAELEKLKLQQSDPKLDFAGLRQVNQAIQMKQKEIDELQKLGTVDVEKDKQIQEQKRQVQLELSNFILDAQSQSAQKQLDLREKLELLDAEMDLKRTGNREQYELAKYVISEKYAIKRIELESTKAIESLEIEKKRFEGLNTLEAKFQLDAIKRKQEEIRKNATQQKGIVRQETSIKTTELDLSLPGQGSIKEQQQRVEESARLLQEATTDDARKAAREQLRIEQDKLDRMTLSNAEYIERMRQRQQNEMAMWTETHRGAMAAIDGITAGFNSMFQQFIIGNRQAADAWDAVWLTMRNTALQTLQEIAVEQLKSFIIQMLMGDKNKKEQEQTAGEKLKRDAEVAAGQIAIAAISVAVITPIVVGGMQAISKAASSAATLVSIATFGVAAAVGGAAVLAALAATKSASEATEKVPGFEHGGRLRKGEAGFFEGKGNEIIAPEKTFIEIARAELIPKILLQQQQFGLRQTAQTISTRQERPVVVDNSDVVSTLKAVQKSIEGLELRNEVVLKETRDWQMVLKRHLPAAQKFLSEKEV